MEIKILGPGCLNCQTLERNVKAALDELGIQANIEEVSDYEEILGYGVISTPGLVIDGRIAASGRVLSKNNVKKLLKTIK